MLKIHYPLTLCYFCSTPDISNLSFIYCLSLSGEDFDRSTPAITRPAGSDAVGYELAILGALRALRQFFFHSARTKERRREFSWTNTRERLSVSSKCGTRSLITYLLNNH